MTNYQPHFPDYQPNLLINGEVPDYQDWRSEQQIAKINQRYYNGSIWPFWIGPLPSFDDDPQGEIRASIKKIFQSANYTKECIDRQVDAVLARFPHWYLGRDSGGSGKSLAKYEVIAAEEMLQSWLGWVNGLAVGQQTKHGNPWIKALTDACISGKGYLRLWAPQRFKRNLNPIKRLCVHAPDPGTVEIHYDADGIAEKIVYSYSAYTQAYTDVDTGASPKLELQSQKEIQFIDEQGYTVVYQVLAGEEDDIANAIASPVTLDLGGKFTIQEIRIESLITDSVRRLQNGIAFTLTMLIRNLVTSGFAERYLLNAQQPGEYQEDGRGGQVFVPSGQFKVGPGQTAFLVGIPQIDAITGQAMGYANPSVSFRDPVPVESFKKSLAMLKAEMYHQFKQSHLLDVSAGISGTSRIQSRQDFETASQKLGDTVCHAIAQVLSAALAMMNPIFADVEIVTQPRLSVSKPTPEERNANRADYQAGLLSLTTAIAQTGAVEDTDAEIALIEEENKKKLENMTAQPAITTANDNLKSIG